MKLKDFLTVSLILLILVGFSKPVSAEPLPISELISHSEDWNNQEVEVKGEAIGDRMQRGKSTWINISDNGAALGIWGDSALLDKVTRLGDYGEVGDIVDVKGVFHLACPDHGGDMDLHVREMTIITPGHNVEHPVDRKHLILSIIGMVVSLILGAILYTKKKKAEKL